MPTSLSVKIIGILLAFFGAALIAIAVTLFVSWQLNGSSAAINDSGSLRMKTYAIGYDLTQMALQPGETDQFREHLFAQIAAYDRTIRDLRTGDPDRPLFVPKRNGIPQEVQRLERVWLEDIRPGLIAIAEDPRPEVLETRLHAFDAAVESYVGLIDEIVGRMEISYARSTSVLQASQVSLIVLAVIGTLVLIRFFFLQVIKPIGELREGIERIEHEDFSARTPVFGSDELGQLSQGFNRTAAHLQDVYATLEKRVEIKTRTLTEKNRELEILYSISDFLHEPSDIDALCRGFLQRVQSMLGASASSVRLLDSGSKNLCITVCEGLDEAFLDREAVLACGACVCGEAATSNMTLFANIAHPETPIAMDACRAAGFRAISASTVSANKRPIGIFNLYFAHDRALGESDRQLLEALGQQLGTAIDNVRLQARERELAVSEERNLLARELHDSIAQGLAFLNLQVQMFEDALKRSDDAEMRSILTMIGQAVQESYDDVRELLVHFRTRVGQQDLDAAIQAALRRLAEQTGIATDFDVQGGGPPLDPEAETQLLYIVQEALSNVRKHADARSVRVWLRRGLEGLTVSVHDDGVGFDDPDGQLDDQQTHLGLHIMRERALRVGGQVSVRSSRGKGTEIRVELARQHEELDAQTDTRSAG